VRLQPLRIGIALLGPASAQQRAAVHDLARTGCEGEEAERVKKLLSDRMTDDGTAWTDVKLILKARKSQS